MRLLFSLVFIFILPIQSYSWTIYNSVADEVDPIALPILANITGDLTSLNSNFSDYTSVSAPGQFVNITGDMMTGSLQINSSLKVIGAASFNNITANILYHVGGVQSIGGNTRGIGAIDLQTTRSSAAQVASGIRSFLGSGFDNTAGGDDSAVVAGHSNSSGGDEATVLGGHFNSAPSESSIVLGGVSNSASGTSAVVLNGWLNQTSSNQAVILNGFSNRASAYQTIVLNGDENKAQALNTVVLNGSRNTANGDYSIILNGKNSDTGGEFATILNGQNNAGGGDYSVVQGKGMELSATADRTVVFGFNELSATSITQPDLFILWGSTGFEKKVGIQVFNPDDTLDIDGTMQVTGAVQFDSSFRTAFDIVSSTTVAVDNTYNRIDCMTNNGDITLNLPTAVGIDGTCYPIRISNASGNKCFIEGAGSEILTPDRVTTFLNWSGLNTSGETLEVCSDNANWQIFN